MFNINEMAEESPTSSSSTTSSTTPSTKGSTPPVEQVYRQTKWGYAELKKVLNPRDRAIISKNYGVFKYGKSETMKNKALNYFHREFPGRSPYAVYHKAFLLLRTKVETIVLLRRR